MTETPKRLHRPVPEYRTLEDFLNRPELKYFKVTRSIEGSLVPNRPDKPRLDAAWGVEYEPEVKRVTATGMEYGNIVHYRAKAETGDRLLRELNYRESERSGGPSLGGDNDGEDG